MPRRYCAFLKRRIDDGEYCLTAGNDKLVKLWNPHRGRQIKTYAGHGREVAAVAVYGNGYNTEHIKMNVHTHCPPCAFSL